MDRNKISAPRITAMLFLAAFALNATAVAALPPANSWIPRDAIIALEVSDPKAILEFIAGEKATAAITDMPLYKQLQQNPKFAEFQTILKFLEISLETEWRPALAKLTGGGITLAVCPDGAVALIVDAEDEKLLNRVHETFLAIARDEAQKAGQADRVASNEYKGVTAWTFNGKESHTIIGSRFVLGSTPQGLKNILDLRDQGENITSNPNYKAARRAGDADSIASVYADVKTLRNIPDIANLLEQGDSNPLVALLLAGITDAVSNSNFLAMGLKIEDSALLLKASVDGKAAADSKISEFALPKKSGDGALANLSAPRMIAGASFYRDLHQFYAAKDELFPARTSGLIFFENMMGIFFTGRDLTNEVLAETEPYVRVVVAEQQFDAAIGTPQLRLPSFALVMRLRNPKEFRPVVEEAWQKAIGLVNFTRGQQAEPGLIIDKPTRGDTTFTVAYFSTVDVEDKAKLDSRFNFRPSLAMPGDYLILSSTDALAGDLIDALAKEGSGPLKPLAGTHSLIELDAGALASILKENRETLVRNAIVKKGITQAEAEGETDMLLTVIGIFKGAELGVGVHNGLTQAQLKLELNLTSQAK